MSNNQQEVCSQCCCPVATAEQAATSTDEPYTCYWPYGGDCAETDIYSASWEKRALAAENKLKHVLQQWKWLSEDVEQALWYQKNRSKGGQQTGHGPELSYIPTSDLLRLQWRCREALRVVKE